MLSEANLSRQNFYLLFPFSIKQLSDTPVFSTDVRTKFFPVERRFLPLVRFIIQSGNGKILVIFTDTDFKSAYHIVAPKC